MKQTRPNPHETAAGTVRSRRDSRWRLENGWDADSAVTLRPDSRPRDARRAS